MQSVGKKHGFDVFTPIKDFTEQQLHVLLYGDREPINGQWSNGANMWMRDGWEGVIPQTNEALPSNRKCMAKGRH